MPVFSSEAAWQPEWPPRVANGHAKAMPDGGAVSCSCGRSAPGIHLCSVANAGRWWLEVSLPTAARGAYRRSWRMLGAVMERFLPDGAPSTERREATLMNGVAPGHAQQRRAVPGVWLLA